MIVTANKGALKEAGMTRDPADSSGLDFVHAKPTTPTIWRAWKRVAWSLSRATSSYTRQAPACSEEHDIFGAPIVVAAAKFETRSTRVAADKADLAGFRGAGAREGDSSSDLKQAKVRAAWAARGAMTLDSPLSKRNRKTVIEVAWGKTASAYTRQKPAWVKEHDTLVNLICSKPTTTNLSTADSVFAVLDKWPCVQYLDEEVRVAEKTWQAAQEFVLNIEDNVEMRKLKVCVHVSMYVFAYHFVSRSGMCAPRLCLSSTHAVTYKH